MKNINVYRYVPMFLCLVTAGKMLVSGATMETVSMLGVLAALTTAFELRSERKVIAKLQEDLKQSNEQLEKQIKVCETAIENTFKQMNDLKGFINSVKLNQAIPNLRPSNGKSNITF